MGLQVEKLEGSMAKLTITVSADKFEEALNRAYLKNKGKIQIQGFRKGKAPRAMIERVYGAGVFYEDAANDLIPGAYDEEIESEEGKSLYVVSQPEIDVVQIGKGQDFIFTATVALRPEVKLGEYKNLEIEKKQVIITEDDVQKELDRIREQNSRTENIEDRPVKDSDIAVIDYEGFVDGNPFEGGKGEDFELTIGSHSFIDTFEEQLIGAAIGDEVEVNVTFPESYHEASLQGKPALFKVKIKAIKEKTLPELNDEFVDEVSDFNTLEEYKADLSAKLKENKQKEAETEYKNAVLAKAVENAEMTIPEPMITTEARKMLNNYAAQLSQQGISMDAYMKYTGMTQEYMLESMKESSKNRIKNALVLEEIAKVEGIEATEEEIEEEMKKMAEAYKMELEKVKELLPESEKELMAQDIKVRKAMELISE